MNRGGFCLQRGENVKLTLIRGVHFNYHDECGAAGERNGPVIDFKARPLRPGTFAAQAVPSGGSGD